MIKHKKALVLILLLVSIISTIRFAAATVINLPIQAGKEETITLNLAVDDHVLIRFTIVGSSEQSLQFFITCPNGTKLNFGKTGTFHYSFVCDLEGEYVLHFSNVDSSEEKTVTGDYEIEHYIFGMPQMLFLVIIIVLVCLAAVAAFVFMGKSH
jgi:hypothetical protein